MYILIKDVISKEVSCIKRISDNVFIPFDEANTDYQEYLKWVAEGNEAEEWVTE
jgi:hypothetical protein